MSRTIRATCMLLAAALTGCASSLSGIGGTERYACKAPEGALCTSVSGVYSNAAQGASHAKSPVDLIPKANATSEPPAAAYGATSFVPGAPGLNAPSSAAIRSSPRILRLWIAPWEDSDGDLHEESIVHVIVDTGRWLIEHVRPRTGHRIDGVSAPAASPTPTPSKPTAETPPSPEPAAFPPGSGIPATRVPRERP